MAEGKGIETLIPWIIGITVLLVIIGLRGTVWGETKGAVETTLDIDKYKEQAEEIYKEVSKTPREVELENANQIADKFIELFNSIEGNDCVTSLNIDEYDANFDVEFRKASDGRNVIRVFKDERGAIGTKNLDKEVYFNSRENTNFILKGFEEIEFNGITYSQVDLVGGLYVHKSLSGELYFYSNRDLRWIINNKLSCEAKKTFDRLSDDIRSGDIDEVQYLISNIKLLFGENLYSKALDAYYRLYRLDAQEVVVVRADQWAEVESIWEEIVGGLEGDFYLCEDLSKIFRCFDLTIQVSQKSAGLGDFVDSSIRENCDFGISEVINNIPRSSTPPWYGDKKSCEESRLSKIGVLPQV